MAQSPQLSTREWEVVERLLQGESNKLIAVALDISERTVEFHLTNIYAKLQVSSRVELILRLGNSTSEPKNARLGDSTVESVGEKTEAGEKPDSQVDWVTSLWKRIYRIGEELRMSASIDPNAYDGASTLTFQESIRVCLAKYADFSGQATRSEFWWFMLFVTLLVGAMESVSETLGGLALIALLLPLSAVGARRLRDTGRSAWWLLFAFAPVGGIVLLAVLWSLPGTAQSTIPEMTG